MCAQHMPKRHDDIWQEMDSVTFTATSSCHRIALQHSALQLPAMQQTVVKENMSLVPDWCIAEGGSGMLTASALLKHH